MSDEVATGDRRGISYSHSRIVEDCTISMTGKGRAVIEYELRGGEGVEIVIDEDDVEKHWKMLSLAHEKCRGQEASE